MLKLHVLHLSQFIVVAVVLYFLLRILDLKNAGVDCVTLGQYMQPTRLHLKVEYKGQYL